MTLPTGLKVKTVELLHAETSIPFRVESQVLRFTIPGIEDYAVAAITVA